jgi:acetyltransferase-like isoleucine patch superfamily enzyme
MFGRPEPAWQRLGRELAARLCLRACDHAGEGARVIGRPRIVNDGRISIGKRFLMSSDPVMSHLFADSGGVIEIGDDVSIGHGTGIAARGCIRIGNGSRIGAFVLAMDTDYHVAGDASRTANISPITIGSGVQIGNRVTILRGALIGDGAVVVDGSVVSGEVPAAVRVAGVPARPTGLGAVASSDGTVELRVRRVARQAFRLSDLPALGAGPAELPAWDSLGTLSFLLALEEEFGVPLGEDQMRDVRTLLDATAMISAALEVA